jgi:hypothetical protein
VETRGARLTFDEGLLDELLAELLGEFPRFRIVPKRSSRLCRLIHLGLVVVTLGGQRRFVTGYHTVLGNTLFVCDAWDTMDGRARYVLLRHERVHLRQARRLGRVGMALTYLFPLLPLGLAWGRARLEWEAYRETLVAMDEVYGRNSVTDPHFRRAIVARFTGPDYGWMWPFQKTVEGWYDRALADMERDKAVVGSPKEPHAEDG